MTTKTDTTPTLRQRAQTVERPQQDNRPKTFQGVRSVREFLEGMRVELARALPRHLTADRLARVTLTEVNRVPLLAQCTVESFGGSLMTAATLGLEPGVGGECWLVPFKNGRTGRYEATLIIGYQGMTKLFWQHPMARSIDAQGVYPEDGFDFAYGLTPRLEHRPSLNRDPESKPYAYYAVATTTSGGSAYIVMSVADIERVRARAKAKDDGPWKTDYEAMARKTCVRRLFKLLPKSTTLALALEHDNRIEGVVSGFAGAQIAAGERPAIEGKGATDDEQQPPPPADEPGGQDEEAPAETGEAVTDAQQKKIHALFRQVEWTDRADKLRAIAGIVDRPVDSTSELLNSEATQLIDVLDQVSKDEDPPTRLGELLEAATQAEAEAQA